MPNEENLIVEEFQEVVLPIGWGHVTALVLIAAAIAFAVFLSRCKGTAPK